MGEDGPARGKICVYKDTYRVRYKRSSFDEGKGVSLRIERVMGEGEGIEGSPECLSRLMPNIRQNKLPAMMGDMHKYPQFSAK